MVRKVVPFRAWHYAWLGPAVEGASLPVVPPDMLAALESGDSWTGMADGEVIGCAGLVKQWPGRFLAWAYFNARSRAHALFIARSCRERLDGIAGRVEMTVREDFALGHKFARALGFEVETPVLRSFGPVGENHVGYVRIR